jgi:diguanylate cyclase (GGDEF)-like protein/PAS domain S-box-containing protein
LAVLLRILLVEDSEQDAFLIERILVKELGEVSLFRVETAETMRGALAGERWDIVLSDHRLPAFSAPEALTVLQESGLDLPFIVLSGMIDEERIVSLLKDGADNFVSKENLGRLVPAVEHAMREVVARRHHKEAAEALRESEEKYRVLVEKNQDGVFLTQDGNIAFANDSFARIIGYSVDEIVGRSTFDFVAPEDAATVADRYRQRMAGDDVPGEYEYKALRKDGVTRVDVHINVAAISYRGRPAALGTIKDITERKSAETALRASEERFRGLIEGSIQGILVHRNFTPLFANQALAVIFGLERPEDVLELESIEQFVAPHERKRIRNYLIARLRGETAPTDYLFQGVRMDGSVIWLENRSVVVDWNGETAVLASLVDVTERRSAEEKLRKSEEEFRTLVDQATDGIFVVNGQGRYVEVNRAGCAMLGYARDELLEMGVEDVLDGDEAAADFSILDSLSVGETVSIERQLRRKDGSIAPVEIDAKKLADGRVLATHRDIGERRQVGEALLAAKEAAEAADRVKDEFLGTMSHELRMPLNTIIGFADIIETEMLGPMGNPKYMEYIKDINVSGKHMLSIITDMIDVLRIESALQGSESSYRQLVEMAPDLICLCQQGEISLINSPGATMLGSWNPEVLIGRPFRGFVHPDFHDLLLDDLRGLVAERSGVLIKLIRADDTEIIVEAAARILAFEGQDAVMIVARDVTERVRAEEGLRLAATVFETTAEAIMVTDANNRIKAVNPAFTAITGYAAEEVIGKDPQILSSGHHDSDFYQEIWSSLQTPGWWEGEIWNRRKNGEVFPEWLYITAIRDDQNNIIEFVGVFSDITQRKQSEEKIRRQANYDALTGLPNRALFFDRLRAAIATARREKGQVALLFIDLDRFKVVNDTLGHTIGDRLLEQTAARLIACVREVDTVARLGGDEFTMILQDVARGEDAAIVAEKIIESLSEPFWIDGNEVFIGGSVGITLYPSDAGDAVTMLRNADMAMYRSKQAGRSVYRFFTKEMDAQVLMRMDLEKDMRRALERGEFVVYYQPIVDLDSGAVTSAEALLRWVHPERGLVSPGEFIPLAEETGLIGPLGEWVLYQACAGAKAWQDAGLSSVGVSVNLSSRQLKRGLTRDTIAKVLRETALEPRFLTFEITETLIMEDTKDAVAWLDSIKEMGIHLSVDDFGTGYSSLSYLKRFPVDVVKIDRAFVRDVTVDPDDAALIEAILAMTHSLNLKVVAEGVEKQDQLDLLRARGCDMVQGFYFSKPVPFEEFLAVAANVGSFRK